jgi:hypothetical protein
MPSFTFAPSIYPDEHYLSRFARFLLLTSTYDLHLQQRKSSGDNSSINFFDIYQPQYYVLFDKFKEIDVENLFREHTLAGFYSHFIRYQERETLIKSKQYKNQKLPFVPYLTMHRHARTWRYCLSCCDSDTANYGTSYWHVSHQLPTSTTCDKHTQETLIDACNVCGYQVLDLKNSPVPTLNCTQCGSMQVSQKAILNEEIICIQNRGLLLHSQSDSLKEPLYEYLMTRGVCSIFAALIGDRVQSSWLLAETLQQQFMTWLIENELTLFFKPMTITALDKILSLEKLNMRPRTVSPMSHILWLRFFELFYPEQWANCDDSSLIS